MAYALGWRSGDRPTTKFAQATHNLWIVMRCRGKMFNGVKMLLIGALVATVACGDRKPAAQSPVERGKYLVTITGCHDCHTPKIEGPGGKPVLDEKRLLAGHPEKAPYPTWTPDDMKQRNALALTNPMLTAWAGGTLGRQFCDQPDAGQRDGRRRMERREFHPGDAHRQASRPARWP